MPSPVPALIIPIDDDTPIVLHDPLWDVLALLRKAQEALREVPADRHPPASENQEIAGLLLDLTMDYVANAMLPAWPELEDNETDCSEVPPARRWP
jgi:hypothetical protein